MPSSGRVTFTSSGGCLRGATRCSSPVCSSQLFSALSAICALILETPQASTILDAALPILYAGIMSVGVGFTLQVVAQRTARADHTAIILSLEAAFAVLGGWLILSETLSVRGLIGCALMLMGMVVSQLRQGDGSQA